MKTTLKLSLLLSLVLLGSTVQAREIGLLVAPFDAAEAGEYSEMRDSIESMLVSRVASRPGIQVVESGLSPAQLENLAGGSAVNVKGLKESDEYLFTGSLFQTGTGLKVQVDIYRVEEGRIDLEVEPQRYTALSRKEGGLIQDMNTLAGKIATGLVAEGRAVTGVAAEKPGQGESGFITRHPEEAWKRGEYASLTSLSGAEGFTAQNVGARSRFEFDGQLLGLQAVDADGDGKEELFLFFPERIEVRRLFGRRLRAVDACSLPAGLRVHAWNIADVDGDGHKEIYLSATRGLSVSSAAMTWNRQKGFTWLAKDLAGYIRPVRLPGRGVTLLAQRRGLARTALRRAGVFIAKLDRGKLRLGGRLPLPKGVNLFDFEYADLDGNGSEELVAIDGRNHLKVFNSAAELLYVSEESYGGSKLYLGPGQGEATERHGTSKNFSVDEDAERELIYMPGRIEVVDFNGDGRQEVVVAQTKMPSMGFLTRLRPWSSGRVTGLTWNGSNFVPFWETASFRGYLSDFDFILGEDEHGVHKGLLYVANLPASGTLLSLLPGSSESTLTAGRIDFSFEKGKEKSEN